MRSSEQRKKAQVPLMWMQRSCHCRGGWEQTPPAEKSLAPRAGTCPCCGQGIPSSTHPALLSAGSHLQPSVTSALGPCAHTEPSPGLLGLHPTAGRAAGAGGLLRHPPHAPPVSSEGPLGHPALVRVLLSRQTPGEESGPGLRQHGHTYSIPSQERAFEVFFSFRNTASRKSEKAAARELVRNI